MDVDWSDPIPSMVYGLSEFLTVLPLVNSGDIVLVDDTPINKKTLAYVQGDERADAYSKNQQYRHFPQPAPTGIYTDGGTCWSSWS